MNRIYKANDNFFSEWSVDMAYILGFISADGCIKNDRRFCICLQRGDIEVLEYMKSAMELTNPIRVFIGSDGTDKCELEVTSPKMCSDLLALNVTPAKTYTILPPDNIPDDYMSHYIRGIFDGDGCISLWRTRGGIQYTAECCLDSASKGFIDRIYTYLLSNGVHSNIYIKNLKVVNRVPIYRIRTCGKNTISFCEFMYSNGGYRLTRKYDKYLDYRKQRFMVCESCGDIYYRSNINYIKCDICRATSNK